MSEPAHPGQATAAQEAAWEKHWQEENRLKTVSNTRALAMIAMVLVPACGVLDFYAYPHLFAHFFAVRVLVSMVEVIFIMLCYTALGQRHYRLLMLLVPLMPAGCIAWMIYCSGDPGSSYYAGLTLCLVGVGFLYQWNHVESIVAVVITLTLYLVATIPLLPGNPSRPDPIGNFVNNGVFLLANSLVIISGSAMHYRIRRNDSILRLRLAESGNQLEEKNARLVEHDRLKTDFFSNITHELRTPLTLMLAPLQSLLRRLSADASEGGNGSNLQAEIGLIYQNALRLLKLINDLLDLASIDSGKNGLVVRRFHLKNFLDGILRSVEKLAQQGGVTLRSELRLHSTVVESDEQKLEKVLLNLLFNAVKFTPSGGIVTLVVQETEREMTFDIVDTGIGIPDESLPYVFDRFWQADSSVTRQHTGTGLGLSLVREFVTLMGGHVEALSSNGTGTTMRVGVPVTMLAEVTLLVPLPEDLKQIPAGNGNSNGQAPPAAHQAASASADWITSLHREAEHSHALRRRDVPGPRVHPATDVPPDGDLAPRPLILIVDDEPGMLEFMRRELEDEYRIVEASNGQSARSIAMEQKPDLIVADYMMPKLDGLGLCRALRENPDTRAMPVMLITARSDEQVRIAALRQGANDVMLKPFSLTEFHSRVQNLVQGSVLQREIETRNVELERTLDELGEARRELMLSEKMAALGVLTGGIMHEINNPLNFTKSALYMLDRHTGKLPDAQRGSIVDIVTDLREGLTRIATIVSDLRLFCHPDAALAGDCAVQDPIQAAARMLAAPIREAGVELHVNVPQELAVRGDRNQITLVFVNLLKNAVDALAAAKPLIADRGIWVTAKTGAGSRVEIEVQDNGPGIPPAQVARVFDPFFTTKAPGEGTGLGLALCYRIVTAHGGEISVVSAPGEGTLFRIMLPAASGKPASQPLEVQNAA